ncbi:hypothetical protein EDL82_19030, partial [Acinetobacter baumannii]
KPRAVFLWLDRQSSCYMKVFHCRRSKIALTITLLCILFSGCTAHTINSNVNVSICARAL